MTKIEFKTSKLYYGFPIFLLGYKDDTWDYNYTTCSSSYTLGATLVIGLAKASNSAKQIEQAGCFSLNIPTAELMKQIEIGGFSSGQHKFQQENGLSYTIAKEMDVPLITECCLSFECQVSKIVEDENFLHIFSKITKRWITADLVENNHLVYEQIKPVYFLGDEQQRVYRYLSGEVATLGDFT